MLFGDFSMSIHFKRVQEKHCDLIFTWANDAEVRKNSFNPTTIAYDTHCKWFESQIASENNAFLLVMLQNNPVGQIRVEFEENIGIINYSVDKSYRKRGFGTLILKEIPSYLAQNHKNIVVLVGKVKKTIFHHEKLLNGQDIPRRKPMIITNMF